MCVERVGLSRSAETPSLRPALCTAQPLFPGCEGTRQWAIVGWQVGPACDGSTLAQHSSEEHPENRLCRMVNVRVCLARARGQDAASIQATLGLVVAPAGLTHIEEGRMFAKVELEERLLTDVFLDEHVPFKFYSSTSS